MTTKILATADLHGNLPDIPRCELLIIAGDICPNFGGGPDRERALQANWLDTKFREWLWSTMTIDGPRHIVGIAGNHDFVFQDRALVPRGLPWIYLEDSSYTLPNGLSIHGIPWTRYLPGWAFMIPEEKLALAFDLVSDKTDIIVSHGPPHGYGDFVVGHGHIGSPAAYDAITRVNPKAFVCGHIHEGAGRFTHPNDTPVYNVAYVDEYYNVRGEIVEILQ